MNFPTIALTYCLFFFSGFAALIYETVWTRYLGLVFGGSHLAVTTVLAVFMTGLAAGSYVIGRKVDSRQHLLRFFGLLELGTAFFALVFAALMRLYPSVYVTLAQLAPESPLYLSCIRFSFAALAIIAPTVLMGGTLPVISAFSTRIMKGAGIRLSFLYGFNTIGAVSGRAVTGFFMLRHFSMGMTLASAVIVNILVGLSAIIMDRYAVQESGEDQGSTTTPDIDGESLEADLQFPCKLVLWGIGVSGFCAMGYEVLWNRILSIAIGASSYGLTILLMAFLSGIGLGSAAFGIFRRFSGHYFRKSFFSLRRTIISFGAVQITIGITALLATASFRSLPIYLDLLQRYFLGLTPAGDQFQIIQLANFILAFSIMFIPAFFMGVAFPLAGDIHCRYRQPVGRAVGEVLFSNTAGAILGAMGSGFILIYFLGIQRSLQIIILINIGYGLILLTSLGKNSLLKRSVACAVLAAFMIPVLFPDSWKLWDPRLYAIYQSNRTEDFGSSHEIKELIENSDIRYYAEGAQAVVSSVQSADTLYFITNGRVEASNAHIDMQCQYTLGHLPMLLHKNPRKVFVLGTGSGMTLGAVSIHPSVEQVTLAEIEPSVLGVAKTFGIDNHYILNKGNPKLKIVFNDGRNHLLTTKEKYDVITADPVHPWFSGAGYLYSTEYFQLVANRLNPGGIMCQWLPLYELTTDDLKSVVKTIRANFAYMMIWVTHYDAEIVASNSPIVIDEADLNKRIAYQPVGSDLRQVKMGSADDLLSYFVLGSEGTTEFGSNGRINTDDNLYLEFSAPRSIGMEHLRGENLADLLHRRERILPYLRKPDTAPERIQQQQKWEANYQAALLDDKAHILGFFGKNLTYEYFELTKELNNRFPRFAPWRFLQEQSGDDRGGTPTILKELDFQLLDENGALVKVPFLAIQVPKDNKLTRVFFVDDNSHTVFGKLRVRDAGKQQIEQLVSEVMRDVQFSYSAEKVKAVTAGREYPSLLTMFPLIKTLVEAKINPD